VKGAQQETRGGALGLVRQKKTHGTAGGLKAGDFKKEEGEGGREKVGMLKPIIPVGIQRWGKSNQGVQWAGKALWAGLKKGVMSRGGGGEGGLGRKVGRALIGGTPQDFRGKRLTTSFKKNTLRPDNLRREQD